MDLTLDVARPASVAVATADIRAVDSPLVADEMTNKVRGIRLEQDLWDDLELATRSVGQDDRSGVIRQFVRWYLRRPGARLPQRPGD